jgi:hypothetical protein
MSRIAQLTLTLALAMLAAPAIAGAPKPLAPPKAPAAAAPDRHDMQAVEERPDGDGGRTVTARRTMAPDGEVQVSNIAGQVRVVAWDRSEVEVSGRIGEDVERLEFGGNESYTMVKVILPHRNRCCEDGDAELTINVPRVARVDVDTVSANVEIDGAAGPMRANTISGEIVLRTRSRDINASSVSGGVDVLGNGAAGRIAARSVSGDIHIEGAEGELETESVSGDVHVKRTRAARLTMKSTSGDVSYEGALSGGSYAFQTVSGDVVILFSGARDATYDITTFSGDIDNAFGPKPRRAGEYVPGYELRFTEGKGASRVRINTLSGEVRLDAR